MAGDLLSLVPDKGADWIERLFIQLLRMRENYRHELDEIQSILFNDPIILAKYYIEPYCQDLNPADRTEEDFDSERGHVKVRIESFIETKKIGGPGSNVMFILSDAGMGKTALLAMIKLSHMTSSWPKIKHCELRKLGKEPINEIRTIKNHHRETLLLLDALDEDPSAYGRVKERLEEILRATQDFQRVIITCRTQFFPLASIESEVHEWHGKVTVCGFTCLAKYLSIFDDIQVDQYLSKRFPEKKRFFRRNKELETKKDKAKEIIANMGYLRCRPMLLAHIEDLIEETELQQQELNNEYIIYKALVNRWLNRERTKFNNTTPTKQLWDACKILATEMQLNGKRTINENELEELKKTNAQVKPVETIDFKGLSLLNRNSDGDYRFSHYSIQEFLVVEQVVSDPSIYPEKKIRHTDFILKLLLTTAEFRHHLRRFDLSEAKLAGQDLAGLDFSGNCLVRADLSGANLSQVKFNGADLTGANLSNAILLGTDFCGADLFKVDLLVLKEAHAEGAKLTGAKYNWVNFLQQVEEPKMNFQEYSSIMSVIGLSDNKSDAPCFGEKNRKRKIYDAIVGQIYNDTRGSCFSSQEEFYHFMAAIACDLLTNKQLGVVDIFNEYYERLAGGFDINVAAGRDYLETVGKQEVPHKITGLLVKIEDKIQFSTPSLAEYFAALGFELFYLSRGRTDFKIPNQGVADFICFERDNLRFIPGGKFMMGEGNMKHEMEVGPFFMGICPVTKREYEQFDPSHENLRGGYTMGDDNPVFYVSSDDADRYCRWLSEKNDRAYRLPTQAEWEFACRAGSKGRYSLDLNGCEVTEKNLYEYAVYNNNFRTMSVKHRKPNFYSLYDMHGSVWEWCQDNFDGQKQNPVLRGGSWNSQPELLRASWHNYSRPDVRNDNIGFRVVACLARTP
jgi:uncharacterized protein YjbI with pentapeptide repeats